VDGALYRSGPRPAVSVPVTTPRPSSPPLSFDERRWLHDKYENLGAEEGQLAATRTSYFATVGAVLLTALVVLVANLLDQHAVFVTAVSLLAIFGILLSSVWAVLLHRTTDAQHLWREAALRLEDIAPPVEPVLPSSITLRSGAMLPGDLARPYHLHRERFSPSNHLTVWDRVDPWTLTEVLPLAFLLIWVGTLAGVWLWYLGAP
jgi:hypothetical protein